MIVVSPHLDDAVFACGDWLAAHPGATVVTVFAGTPRDATRRTAWDERCGFASAADAVAARRHEDRAALSRLGATPLWLSFADRQYDEPAGEAEIAAALAELLKARADDTVLLPLGLFHSDHRLAHRAAWRALREAGRDEAWAYEDALYRGMPGQLQSRLAALHREGLQATPLRLTTTGVPGAKAGAIACYASQLRAFGPGGTADLGQPERFWRLAPRDAEGLRDDVA